jgi:hypothetical protein
MTAILPADVHARVVQLHAEVDRVRRELGRPTDDRARYNFTGVAPREVYFVARALLERASRLAVEHTGEPGAPPPPAAVDALEPAHVHEVVTAAHHCIRRVATRIGLAEASPAAAVDPAKQPTDCLHAILQLNRQLDRLLARPIAPGDVDAQLALATSYLGALSAAAGSVLPDRPALERGKRPGDVHVRITAALRALRPIVGTMLEPSEVPIAVDEILPSDCYDVASLTLGEVAFLHASRKLPPPAISHGIDTGPRLPSHCYQRAAQLEAGAVTLARASR